ncbi:DMT family transporter [Marinobacterium jannaschii]|uniref:DMT family transporter n=1 Tax=Marinobacterium jannaschii TaxID=64970 RepID=UPI0004840E2D|nr:multidrug efflux SMR transporter [Marinobacterium jannaschii]
MSGWTFLLLGIAFEVAGTYCLKLSQGFSNLVPSVSCFVLFAVAISLIIMAAKTIDVSIVYAVWSGVGIVMVSTFGVLVFQEQISAARLLFIAMILIGVIGLHSVSSVSSDTTTGPETSHVHPSE